MRPEMREDAKEKPKTLAEGQTDADRLTTSRTDHRENAQAGCSNGVGRKPNRVLRVVPNGETIVNKHPFIQNKRYIKLKPDKTNINY